MPNTILVVDDEEIIRDSISFVLKKEGYLVTEAANGKEAYKKLCEDSFDLIITDLEMPEMKGLELLGHATQLNAGVLVVIITAYGSMETAIEALRKGASDYILKPVEFDELIIKVRRLLDYKNIALENQYLQKEVNREYDFSKLVGKSSSMKAVFKTIQKIAETDSTVLVTGKSGTGKELVSRAIHYHSRRRDKPFIAINAGAIPETLIESELFGHRKGSFTGAIADKAGYFKAADGGSLLLDEISEMPLQLQVKLLRAIEQREVTPVGMTTPMPIDVRIIASTNRDLNKEVAEGRFRQDLYYRLNVVEIHLPPLSERRDDIPILVDHFVEKFRKEMRKDIKGVKSDVMRLLMRHEWKGEIRELENIIERAIIFAEDTYLTQEDLPDIFQPESGITVPVDKASLQAAIGDFERQYILTILRKHDFDKEQTASELRISLPTLYRRIKDLEISQDRQ